jgi:hypothetical protein
MKCAAIPKNAPPKIIQSGGVFSFEYAMHEGRIAKATAKGSGEKILNLK